jgi:dsRNA-specific ribonuclease
MNRVANNHNLANVFDTANLSPHVIGNPSQQGVISPKTKATLVEALLGAVSEDGGIEAALEVMHTLEIE